MSLLFDFADKRNRVRVIPYPDEEGFHLSLSSDHFTVKHGATVDPHFLEIKDL